MDEPKRIISGDLVASKEILSASGERRAIMPPTPAEILREIDALKRMASELQSRLYRLHSAVEGTTTE